MKRIKKVAFGLTLVLLIAFLTSCGIKTGAPAFSNGDIVVPDKGIIEEGAIPTNETNGTEEKESANNAAILGNFAVQDIEGNEVTQEIFASKKLTMLNVWGTFCGPCLDEMPDLAEIHKEYEEKGFQIVGLVGDTLDVAGRPNQKMIDVAKKIVQETGVTYTNLVPSGDLLSFMTEITAFPTTIFLDSEGKMVGKVYMGAYEKSDWVKIIDEYLSMVS